MSGAGSLEAVREALGPRALVDGPLGALTTYRVGGRAALSLTVDDPGDLDLVHRALVAAGGPVPVFLLGKGSNLLVADAGFPGLVLTLGPGLSQVDLEGSRVRAGGGAGLPVVARRSAAAGLRGLEWAVGVPGSVGGALFMNAGGHGSETAAVLSGCRIFDLSLGRAWEGDPAPLGHRYRHSTLGPADVVVWADFQLEPGDRGEAEQAIAEIVRWRRLHQPGGANAGSVFTNPPGDSAGRLVDAAGLRGFRLGSARVSEKHANFIQADPGGTAGDVRLLVDRVRAQVAALFSVELVPELRMLGFDDEPLPTVTAPAATAFQPSTSTGA